MSGGTPYPDEFFAVASGFVSAADDVAKTQAVKKAIELNNKTIANVEALRVLADSYRKLPAAHAALALAVNESAGTMESTVSFINETSELQDSVLAMVGDR